MPEPETPQDTASDTKVLPVEVLAAERILVWKLMRASSEAACRALTRWIELSGGVYMVADDNGYWHALAPILNSWQGLGLIVEAMEVEGWSWHLMTGSNSATISKIHLARSRITIRNQSTLFRAVQIAALHAYGVDQYEIRLAVKASERLEKESNHAD